MDNARPPGIPADDPQEMILNRYRVQGVFGEGSFGRVVRAFDTRLKRTVAIKTLKRSDAATDPDYYRTLEDRFSREAEAGAQLGDHVNVVTVYDLVPTGDGSHYLICQYVPGGTLADRIRWGPLPLPDALRLTADVARGLQVAHDAGIVHRDIKPANIFLAADGHAQVGDFGIAQLARLSQRTHLGKLHPGTPLYMSPEQGRTTGYVRPETDQYSLGLVLFEMLMGQRYKELRGREVERLLAEQPPAVRALIQRMTAENGDERYETMADVIAAIWEIESLPDAPNTPVAETKAIAPPVSPEPPPVAPRDDGRTERAPARPLASPTDTEPAPTVQDVSPSEPAGTAHVALSPVAPPPPVSRAASPATPPQRPSRAPVRRRAVLIGVGGLVVAAGSTGAAILVTQREHTPGVVVSPPAATVIPTPLVREGTPVPPSVAKITPESAARVMPLARWGKGRLYKAIWSVDGKQIVAASGTGVFFYDAQTLAQLRWIESAESGSTEVLSPDGQTIATASFDKTARLWKVNDGSFLQTLSGHTSFLWSVAFSPDGQSVATGSYDNTARLWKVSDGGELHFLFGHGASVTSVAFSPDGQIVATGSSDKTARLWKVSDGSALRTLSGHNGQVSSVAFSPDGQSVATASGDGTIRIWGIR